MASNFDSIDFKHEKQLDIQVLYTADHVFIDTSDQFGKGVAGWQPMTSCGGREGSQVSQKSCLNVTSNCYQKSL